MGVIGTPQYMSPEQAGGRWQDVGPASDTYSLGATLYAILTGRTAFPARDMAEVLHKVREGDFAAPMQVKPEVPPALEAICLKAMAFDAADRYPTALDLAADVERWLADEPVSAYRETPRARLARWSRRHRSLVRAAEASLVVGLVASAALAYQQSRSAGRERSIATLAQGRLVQVEKANELLASIFGDLDPQSKDRDDKALREIMGDRLKRVATQLEGEAIGDRETVAKLQGTLGKSLLYLGFRDEATALFARAERTRVATLGVDHPDTLSSRNNLATAYAAQGRYSEAVAMHEANLRDPWQSSGRTIATP